MNLIERVLPPAQRELLARLATRPAVWRPFYLAGGTALALQLGHRRSRDFDLFSPQPFEVGMVRRNLEELAPPLTIRHQTADTFLAEAMGVQFSAFIYPYPLVEPPIVIPGIPVPLAGLKDLAAMKVSAIGQRGVKRDFVSRPDTDAGDAPSTRMGGGPAVLPPREPAGRSNAVGPAVVSTIPLPGKAKNAGWRERLLHLLDPLGVMR